MNAQVPSAIEKADRSQMSAGSGVHAIVPQTFEQAWRFAQLIASSGMAPKGFEKPEACMVALLHGLELGLTPMAALQSIAVVNGRPSVWGDGAIGLVRGSGLCEWIEESLTDDGENMRAVCLAKRKGDPKPARGEFSVADAKKAGLWSKQGPWTQYPKRMLQARARAFAIRDGFADVLRGVAIREEMADVERAREARDVTPPRPPRPDAPAKLTPPNPNAPVPLPEPAKPAEPEIDWSAELTAYSDRIASCEAEEALSEAVETFGGIFDDAPEDVRAEARKAAEAQRQYIARQNEAPHAAP